ncbi:GHMP family kinase ATP-binding protein [Herbidospora cretacea]|uniref:GHMP family kinase ATP-binding protein n=1 Tax=Herbidospora cretacea TaxID=28444 RepID=UPI000B3166D2|nr:hypothetical protein [Herbidospora cretacea]
MTAQGFGHARGTFGELLQGVLPDGRHFLVTLPITAGVTARFQYLPDADELTADPEHKRKSLVVARRALTALGRRGGGRLRLTGDLPEGKGMASSSADLVATARAVADAVKGAFAPAEVEALLRGIEPSDGVMYDDAVVFHHREVRLHSRLGPLPDLVVVGYDEGGQVDTVEYNRRLPTVGRADRVEFAHLLDRLSAAVRAADVAEIGRVATRSAELHAARRERRAFAAVRRASDLAGGLGVVAAHSGTLLGVLLAGDDPDLDQRIAEIRRQCAALGGPLSVHRAVTHLRAEVNGAA